MHHKECVTGGVKFITVSCREKLWRRIMVRDKQKELRERPYSFSVQYYWVFHVPVQSRKLLFVTQRRVNLALRTQGDTSLFDVSISHPLIPAGLPNRNGHANLPHALSATWSEILQDKEPLSSQQKPGTRVSRGALEICPKRILHRVKTSRRDLSNPWEPFRTTYRPTCK